MRRSASEIIRNLEMRIARLEKQSVNWLKIDSGKVQQPHTQVFQSKKRLRAKNDGTIERAIESASFYAKKHSETYYVYLGNSYMNKVWNLSLKESDYLNPINNMGTVMYSVSPDIVIRKHNILRK